MDTVSAFLRGPRWRLVAAGSGAFVLFALVVLGGNSAARVFEIRKKTEALQREIQALEVVNDQLSRTIDRLREDPQLIEQIAREDLGMVKPGERVLRFPRSPESNTGTSQEIR